MKAKKTIVRLGAILLVWMLLMSSLSVASVFAENVSGSNKFNVMLVIDASGSMKYTDPNELRFEAIEEFTKLLAEHGNYLGGVVFATDVMTAQDPIKIDSQADKDRVVQQLEDIKPNSGWTNTGDGLMTAVNALLDKGDPNLPSVIVFLSDGNTKLGDDEATQLSNDTKAEAIQKARENGIPIYSVCLNAETKEVKKADVTEMDQISKATGGVFQEVKTAEDLSDVFNTFYNLIYGTATIPILDETFPDSGVIEKPFRIPGIGVEEVNVIIYGNTSELQLIRPDNTPSSAEPTAMRSLTMIKITDVVPGVWRIIAKGVPRDQIKVNMVYNTNLGLNVYSDPADSAVYKDSGFKVCAALFSGNKAAQNEKEYEGYSAELHVLDAQTETEQTVIPMQVVGDHFEVIPALDIGSYKFKVSVAGEYTGRDSDVFGPVTVVEAPSDPEPAPPAPPANTPPTPVEDPVEKTVTIWPFKENVTEIDMTGLAVDKEDSSLYYKILSSSFMEGTDYDVDGDLIKLHHYSLSKGAFTVRATDKGGLSCDIEVIVKSHNAGTIALIGVGALALLGLAIFGAITYYLITRPFRGKITAQSIVNGTYKGTPRVGRRGRMKLSVFGMDQTGLDYRKSYFQATGKPYVVLHTDKPVMFKGEKTKKIEIKSGAELTISVSEGSNKMILVRFDSNMKDRGRGGGPRPVRGGNGPVRGPVKAPVKRPVKR